jgi:hypothetical protein
MLPKFRVIVGGVILTLLALMASGRGLVPMQESYTRIGDVPQVGRNLLQQAIMASPEQHHFAMVAAARRTSELQRLHELPAPIPVAAPVQNPPAMPSEPSEPASLTRLIESVSEPVAKEASPVGAAPPAPVAPDPSVAAPPPLPAADKPAEPRSKEVAAPPAEPRAEEIVAALPTAEPDESSKRTAAEVTEDIGEPARPILNAPLPRANPRLAALARNADGSVATDPSADTAPVARKPRPVRRSRPVRRPAPPAAANGFFPDNNGTWAFGPPVSPAR